MKPGGCAAALVAVLAAGCGGRAELAARLAGAARPSSLPHVVSCWEKEFEGSQFQGGFSATVDFTVEAETSRVKDARVTQLVATDPERAGDVSRFKGCLESALNRSALPVQDGKDGPGFQSSSDLVVTGYRIAFVDDSSQKRSQATARQANVLLGPRADRCQGLYSHDPPRDASKLSEAIAEGESRAAHYRSDNPDAYARELQKTYDSQLELRERLVLDLSAGGLPEANRRAIQKLLDQLEGALKKTGAVIGCTPPRAKTP